MAANRKALVESPRTMFEQSGGLVRNRRLEEAVMLSWLELLAFEERHHLAEDGGVSGCLDIMGDGIGKPCSVVRNSCTHALAGMWQPPMLNIALDELPRRRPEQMLARHRRAHGGERHAVLQLIAEAIGSARLIEGRAGPDAASERLIEEPSVQHDIH